MDETRRPSASGPSDRSDWDDVSPATDHGVAETDDTVPLHRARRAALTALTLLVLLALTSAWWPRASRTAGDDQLRLTVSHEHHVRPGVDSSVEVAVDRPGAGPVTITVDRDLLDVAGVTDVHPEPAQQLDEGSTVALRYAQAPARFQVVLSGRVPTRQPPGRERWDVGAASGRERAQLTTTVWVLP